MELHLLMSEKERRRQEVLASVRAGSISLAEACEVLGISRRQGSRIYGRYCQAGAAGLLHRSRGKPSNRRRPEAFRQEVLSRYKEYYPDFGPTLASEKLLEEGLVVDHETLRRWLLSAKMWQRQRKRDSYRQRRERRARRGELVQMDGSHHRWFGQEREQCCVMQFIDDATGERLAIMDNEETSAAAMRGLWQWILHYGIPQSLYVDRKSVFYTDRDPTLEEQLDEKAPSTQFGKACERLGIRLIFAHSPQAKGRVERAHGVLQDRLVKELRLKKIVDIEGANALLSNGFMKDLNRRFAKAPKDECDAHRKLPKKLNLADVFCFEEIRRLNNDFTISYQNRIFQVEASQAGKLPKPKDRIAVRTRLDGTLFLVFKEQVLAFHECAAPTPKMASTKPVTAQVPKTKYKPPRSHPWKQGCTLMRAKDSK